MVYEYEDKINEAFFKASRNGRNVNGELLKELQEVYRKAKAFDAIVNIQDDFVEYHGFYPCVEEYAEEVEDIISEYLEDK